MSPGVRRTREPARRAWLAALAALSAGALVAAAEEPPADEEAELLAILEQETAVATKSRMNSDYVPGIVTVLEGDELEALGVATVWEALAMVPGVQPVRGSTPSTVVRGIQFPFNSGNVKILLDGVPLTRQSSGINGAILDLPIEQVERIEVIRGPGSVVYGDFAFMGLINILTRKEGSRAHLRADSGESVAAGVLATTDGEKPWRLRASVAALVDDDAAVPAPRRGEEERESALLSLAGGGFSLSGQLLRRELDDVSAAGTPGAPAAAAETSWALEAAYERELGSGLRAALRADLLDSDADNGPITFEDRVVRLAVDLAFERWARQSWLLGVEYVAQDIQHAALAPPPPAPGLPPVPPLVLDGRERNVVSVLLQDQVELGEAWSVTAGARFDDYDDVGSRVTPRLSIVYRASERHVFKVQHAEGFRAPTFFEAYGGGALNRELDFEVNSTTELNYVYRRPRLTARATLFRSRLEDMIFVAAPRFANSREAEARGVELEWTQQVTGAVKVIANLSWVDTEDDRGPTFARHESESAADWMGDLALLARPTPHTVLGLHWHHVDDRPALAGDDAYDLVDLTATFEQLGVEGLSLRVGVENALDDEVVYVAVPPNGMLDRQRFAGREVWVRVSWSW